jgi:biotin synthase
MIAVTRLYLQDVNIAAATALQALAPNGREQGLLAGANVIMPNLTDPKYRTAYQLYDGKPCLDESATQCRGCLEGRIASLGETIGFGKRGDSHRFQRSKDRLRVGHGE